VEKRKKNTNFASSTKERVCSVVVSRAVTAADWPSAFLPCLRVVLRTIAGEEYAFARLGDSPKRTRNCLEHNCWSFEPNLVLVLASRFFDAAITHLNPMRVAHSRARLTSRYLGAAITRLGVVRVANSRARRRHRVALPWHCYPAPW